ASLSNQPNSWQTLSRTGNRRDYSEDEGSCERYPRSSAASDISWRAPATRAQSLPDPEGQAFPNSVRQAAAWTNSPKCDSPQAARSQNSTLSSIYAAYASRDSIGCPYRPVNIQYALIGGGLAPRVMMLGKTIDRHGHAEP